MSGIYFLKFLELIFLLSPFEKLHMLFCVSIFFFNILLQHHVWNAFMTLSSFFPRVHVSDP